MSVNPLASVRIANLLGSAIGNNTAITFVLQNVPHAGRRPRLFSAWTRPWGLDVLAIQLFRYALYRETVSVEAKQFSDHLRFLGIHLQPGAGDERPAVLIAACRIFDRHTAVSEDVSAVVQML
ncbi:MAG: hypothetical protein WCA91_10920 [Candidatus Acidiferrales bacterium]